MRLLLTFVTLLLLGSVGMTLAWEDLALARDGELAARLSVIVGWAVAFASLALLARIIYRISRPPRLKEVIESCEPG